MIEDNKKGENKYKIKRKKRINVFITIENIHLISWFVNGFEIADLT